MISLFSISCLIVTVVLGSFTPRPNHTQNLEAWKAALNSAQTGRGCESIPYPNYRDQCQRQQAAVEDLCKTENWSCKGLETRSLRENIKNLGEKINTLKSDRDKLRDQKSNAKTDSEKSDIDRKIDEAEKRFTRNLRNWTL
jgi:hypothetical protein